MADRPTESEARKTIESWLEQRAPGYPEYGLCEDGESGWAFWIAPEDTTSYLRADMSIEWYGTGWPEFRTYDEETGNWKEAYRGCLRELKTTDIPDAIRDDVETLRILCANNDPAWRALCNVMRALAAQLTSAGDLLARLQDACKMPDGGALADHAEPWGCDVGLIREAIAAIQDATAIPDGWKISGEENGDVRVCAPNVDPGILTVSAKERPLANRLLYALATSLLAASPQPEAKAKAKAGADVTDAMIDAGYAAMHRISFAASPRDRLTAMWVAMNAAHPKPAEGGAVGGWLFYFADDEDEVEATYATAERLAKPAATVKCDYCGARPGDLHAFDCVALDETPKPADGGAVDPDSPSFLSGLATGRGESEYICGLLKDPKCDRCGARNALEAETMCKPSDDSCPGVEWPLERIWQLAAPAGSGEAVAWYSPLLDAVITATEMAGRIRDESAEGTTYTVPLHAGAAPAVDAEVFKRAADMLDGFERALVRYAPIEDIEEWPYHPEITDTAEQLRRLSGAKDGA